MLNCKVCNKQFTSSIWNEPGYPICDLACYGKVYRRHLDRLTREELDAEFKEYGI